MKITKTKSVRAVATESDIEGIIYQTLYCLDNGDYSELPTLDKDDSIYSELEDTLESCEATDYTQEDLDAMAKRVYDLYMQRVNDVKKEDLEPFSNRKSIIEQIRDWMHDSGVTDSPVSAEDILDAILENGKK
jgi:hypothetical protein